MERNQVLDLGSDSLGQRVAQKISSAAITAGQKIDVAVTYVHKGKSEVAQSVGKIGCEGLKQKVVDYARREPLTALAAATAAGILLAWVTTPRSSGDIQ